jgi:putative FmdB family regulatory protein
MPIYEYRCSTCESQFTVYRTIDAMRQAEQCQCGSEAHKVISAPMIAMDSYTSYSCPITGKQIEGKRQHVENLKKHGCRVYEAGETEQFKKRRAQEQERATDALLDRILPKSIGDTIHG